MIPQGGWVMEDASGGHIDGRAARVVEHPIRAGFLRLLACRGTLTPKEALRELAGDEELTLSQIVYHAGLLERNGLVEPAGNLDRERGYPFRPTSQGRVLMVALGCAPKGGGA